MLSQHHPIGPRRSPTFPCQPRPVRFAVLPCPAYLHQSTSHIKAQQLRQNPVPYERLIHTPQRREDRAGTRIPPGQSREEDRRPARQCRGRATSCSSAQRRPRPRGRSRWREQDALTNDNCLRSTRGTCAMCMGTARSICATPGNDMRCCWLLGVVQYISRGPGRRELSSCGAGLAGDVSGLW